MKSVALDRRVGNLLKEFIAITGETFQDSFAQSIFDYINILSHVCGDNPNSELVRIMHDFEFESQIIFKKIDQSRREYLRLRKEEALLLDKKIPNCDNKKYIIIVISDELYNGIDAIVKKYPNVFSNDKHVTIRDIVSRAVLFRVMQNEPLMKNNIYRTWRLEVLLGKENRAKLNLENALEIVSRKMKVIWNDK